MKIKKTTMMTRYLVKFAIRIMIFSFVFIAYILNKDYLFDTLSKPLFFNTNALELLWLIYMIMMILHLFPREPFTMALLKCKENMYVPTNDFSKEDLFDYSQKMNFNAWVVMLTWISFNAIFGLLYAYNVIDSADLFMLTVFYFLCDYICILVFCPFQSFIMKNKCCVNCRIYDWGHFMMFTPMVFIRSFYTWSLFFVSLIVLIRWELIYAQHPERFFMGTNQNLQCAHCKDKTCQIKNGLKRQYYQRLLHKEMKELK